MGPSDAVDSRIAVAQIQNAMGLWIAPTVPALQAAMDASPDLGHRLTGSLINTKGLSSYPIAGYTYIVVRMATMKNCTVAMEIYRLLNYVLVNPLARNIAADFDKAPLSENVLEEVRKVAEMA